LNNLEFVSKAVIKHKDRYDYSQVDYIDSTTKIIILCKNHGSFLQIPSSHIRGSGCSKCAGKYSYTSTEYIEKVKDIHGNFYNYTKTKYTNNASKLIITCPIHGDFKQNPSDHLNGSGCKKCHIEHMKYSTEQFIENAKKVYGEKHDYDLVNYMDSESFVKIICPIHGVFEKRPRCYLQGKGCQKCGYERIAKIQTLTHEEALAKCIEVHGDNYDYSKYTYTNSYTKSTIICKIHGEFEQTSNAHSKGVGCPRCGEESHWKRSDYIKKANGRKCTFYTLRCFNDQEEFYKIGITMRTIKKRYMGDVSMPYHYEIISEVFGEAGSIWDMEKDEKTKLKNFHYTPNIKFCGSKTECFTQFKIAQDE